MLPSGIIKLFEEAASDPEQDVSEGVWKAFTDFMEHVGIELEVCTLAMLLAQRSFVRTLCMLVHAWDIDWPQLHMFPLCIFRGSRKHQPPEKRRKK